MLLFFVLITAMGIVGLMIYFAAFYESHKKMRQNKKYIEKSGQADIKKLKEILTEHNLPIPDASLKPLDYVYASLITIQKYASKKIEAMLSEKDLKYEFLSKDVSIIYNSTQIMFPSDTTLLFMHTLKITPTDKGLIYHNNCSSIIHKNITVDEMHKMLNELDDKSFYLATPYERKNITWYLNGVADPQAYFASLAASATLGGLAFGGIGAIGSAMSANNKNSEAEKDCKLIFSTIAHTWEIAVDSTSVSFIQKVKLLNEICPDRHGKDIPRKYN